MRKTTAKSARCPGGKHSVRAFPVTGYHVAWLAVAGDLEQVAGGQRGVFIHPIPVVIAIDACGRKIADPREIAGPRADRIAERGKGRIARWAGRGGYQNMRVAVEDSGLWRPENRLDAQSAHLGGAILRSRRASDAPSASWQETQNVSSSPGTPV